MLLKPVLLKKWINENNPSNDMVYYKSFFEQMQVFTFIPCRNAYVISTHTSKSILLPVVKFTFNNGNIIIVRCNFHDIKVSAILYKPFPENYAGILFYNSDEKINPIYCEGFNKDLVFDSYKTNKSKFTVELNGCNYEHLNNFVNVLKMYNKK